MPAQILARQTVPSILVKPPRILRLTYCCLLLTTVSVGCSVNGFDASVKASMVDKGASKADLIKAAGPPTRRVAPPSPDCAKAGGTDELIYDVTIRYLGGWLGEDPSSLVSFCIDPSSRIIQKLDVVF
jgi:hypothetical protein